MADPQRLHSSTPAELQARIAAQRAGQPFLELRDAAGAQRIIPLGAGRGALSLGRDASADVAVPWDGKVSRLHATLEAAGSAWTIADDGLSRNGTFVNLERVVGRRRLRSGDVVRVGDTDIAFHEPGGATGAETSLAQDVVLGADLSKMQRKVLVALCRPLRDQGPYAVPATNQDIADEVFLTVVAVKTHLRTLFAKFGLQDLPQNAKRAALAEAALRSGSISERDFDAAG